MTSTPPVTRLRALAPAGIPALQNAIRHLHGVDSRHVETVHVHEKAPATGETVWRGDVEVFELVGHPQAKRGYAWSDSTTGTKRRFFSVLHAEPIDSAAKAGFRFPPSDAEARGRRLEAIEANVSPHLELHILWDLTGPTGTWCG